jgi:excisionase family DNA binding protein
MTQAALAAAIQSAIAPLCAEIAELRDELRRRPPVPANGLLTLKEAAAYAGCCEETFRRHASRGRIPDAKRIGGGAWRFTKSGVDAWLGRCAR